MKIKNEIMKHDMRQIASLLLTLLALTARSQVQNMIVYNHSGSPTKSLVKDHFIQFCIAGWLISFFIIIYL